MKSFERSHHIYELINKINEVILHAKSQQELFERVSHTLTELDSIVFAWIGVVDDENNSVIACCKSGNEQGYLDMIKISTDTQMAESKGPTGKAVAEGKHYYCNDIEHDPVMQPWHDEAINRGFRSSIALPILIEEKVTHVLTLYSSKAFFFTEEDVQLFVRVAENISFAINAFSINEKRKLAEKQLQKIMQAVEQSSASIVITDINGTIEYVNQAFSKVTGYSFKEAIGSNPKILKTGYTSDTDYVNMWDKLTHQQEWHGEFYNRKKNGELYWEYAVITPVINEDGLITNYVAVKENITERKRLQEEQKELNEIIEHTKAFVATANIERKILFMNNAMRGILEISLDEDITSYEIFDFIEDKSIYTEKIKTAVFESGKWIGENVFLSRSGKKIPVLQVIVLHKNERDEPTHTSSTAIDLSNVKNAEQEMRRLNNELRDLSRHLQKVREIEKKEIAREIHDELGQELTSLKFGISWIKRHIDSDKDTLEKKLDEVLDDLKHTMDTFRRIQSSLHPALLETSGLHIAAEWLIANFKKSNDLPVHFESGIENAIVDFDSSLAIYRLIQESLTNIVRYAKATQAKIKLQIINNHLVLDIQDNGIGFVAEAIDTANHHGLLGMRERVYALNGIFSIETSPGNGAKIHAEIPLL